MSMATIRSWRRRLGGSVPVSGGFVLPGPVGEGLGDGEGGGELERLRGTVVEARASVGEAVARSRQMAKLGNDAAAREAAARAKLTAATVKDLESALAAAEASESRLSEFRAKQIVAVISAALRCVSVRSFDEGMSSEYMGPALRGVLRELLTAAATGEDLRDVKLEGAQAARDEIWGPVRAMLREELRAEVAAELEVAAEQVRADEGALSPAPVLELVEDAEGEGEEDAGEPAPVLEPALAMGSDGVVSGRGVLRMGVPKGGGPRGGSLSLAERLARGGVENV